MRAVRTNITLTVIIYDKLVAHIKSVASRKLKIGNTMRKMYIARLYTQWYFLFEREIKNKDNA